MSAAILAAVLALLQALVRALGLAADRQQIAAGEAEQKLRDQEAADALQARAVAAEDAWDRLAAADRERLRTQRGYYRD